jgi:hypothetical protein
MSDLQCPANVLLIPREILASDDFGRALACRRLSGFFVDTTVAADPKDLAAISGHANACDCPVEIVPKIADGASLTQALEELADVYRGETVAVVTTAKVIQARLNCTSKPTEPIAIAIDSSGWTVTRS